MTSSKCYFISFYDLDHASIGTFLNSTSHLPCILASKFVLWVDRRRVQGKLLSKESSSTWILPLLFILKLKLMDREQFVLMQLLAWKLANRKIVLLVGGQRVTNVILHIKFLQGFLWSRHCSNLKQKRKEGRRKEHLNQHSVNMLEQFPKPLVICDKDINNSHCQPSLSSDLPLSRPDGCFPLILSLGREKGLYQASV